MGLIYLYFYIDLGIRGFPCITLKGTIGFFSQVPAAIFQYLY